ncbi:NAD(P)-binding protein [Lentinula edodes]|nr:NAD(P)-binding protein [Lentinula edodes]
MASLVQRLYRIFVPPSQPPKVEDSSNPPIKFGILGAANIAPPALILPAKSHAEVIVYAVAARDQRKAENFAKKHGIVKVYGGSNGYQQLLDDPEVDAIYNPLPNGLHFEWTMKALLAGKHVLCEKPMADTAEEVKQMFDLAEKKGLVLLEAFHYRWVDQKVVVAVNFNFKWAYILEIFVYFLLYSKSFHPAIQRAKAVLDSGELGKIKSIDLKFTAPAGAMKDSDIRFNLALGGGATMDLGCYSLNCIRYLSSSDPTSVVSAIALPLKSANIQETKIDRAMSTTLALPNDVLASMEVDLSMPWEFFPPKLFKMWVVVKCEGGDVEVQNFVLPTFWHSIKVSNKVGGTTTKRVEKALDLGEDWWLTYRYQLEAFVDKVKGRIPQTWVTREDSIANMQWIENIYEKLSPEPKGITKPEQWEQECCAAFSALYNVCTICLSYGVEDSVPLDERAGGEGLAERLFGQIRSTGVWKFSKLMAGCGRPARPTDLTRIDFAKKAPKSRARCI